MIEADKDRFRTLMMSVAVDKRYQDQLDRATMRIMFDSLKPHVTIDELEHVAPSLMAESRFFPRVDEWLAAVEKLPPANVAGLLPGRTLAEDPSGKTVRYCDKCDDTGWVVSCEREVPDGRKPGRQPGAVRCSCREVNPALGAGQRKKRRSEP
jgi:hypothetical protein